jgi:hypothetical protein
VSTPAPDRVLTQNALTGEWLSTALPVTDLEYGDELNGPGSLTGTLAPHLLASNPTLADPGNTLIYVESGGALVWGGLVWDVRTEGSQYAIEAASWSSYLQKRYDLDGEFGGRGPYTYTDRCQVVRDIWTYAQSVADGNLGVVVDSTTSTSKVGTPADVYHSYWYDTNCLGDKIDDLVSEDATPDYTCTTAWNATRRRRQTDPAGLAAPRRPPHRHQLLLRRQHHRRAHHRPRGRRLRAGRHRLRAGDGSAKLRQISAVRNGRLRLEAAIDAPELNGNDTLKARAEAERAWRQVMGSVDTVTLRSTSAARIGSWQVGDDVYTRVHNAWTSFTGWCRITGWTIKPTAQGGPQAVISLKPSAMYNYGGVCDNGHWAHAERPGLPPEEGRTVRAPVPRGDRQHRGRREGRRWRPARHHRRTGRRHHRGERRQRGSAAAAVRADRRLRPRRGHRLLGRHCSPTVRCCRWTGRASRSTPRS